MGDGEDGKRGLVGVVKDIAHYSMIYCVGTNQSMREAQENGPDWVRKGYEVVCGFEFLTMLVGFPAFAVGCAIFKECSGIDNPYITGAAIATTISLGLTGVEGVIRIRESGRPVSSGYIGLIREGIDDLLKKGDEDIDSQ